MAIRIPFNKPHLVGRELEYIRQAVESGDLSGNNLFTRKCHAFFQERYGFRKVLLTTSCTDALEMCALLVGIEPGDEVIVPTYTFVSSALAFVRQGARIVFVDSRPDHPGIDEAAIEARVTPRTKAIVVVHYAGVACDMDQVMAVADRHGLVVVEDAAHATDATYRGRPLGGIGHLGCFSFHSTKNVSSGEGGMLAIRDERFVERSEILWEKGTNRASFFRGEVSKYGWVDLGSSFLPSELVAAYLYGQLERLEDIQRVRIGICERYRERLAPLEASGHIRFGAVPPWACRNGHMFFLLSRNRAERDGLISALREDGVLAVFHYLCLHRSPFYASRHDGRAMPQAERYEDTLVRLPVYYTLEAGEVDRICDRVRTFFGRA